MITYDAQFRSRICRTEPQTRKNDIVQQGRALINGYIIVSLKMPIQKLDQNSEKFPILNSFIISYDTPIQPHNIQLGRKPRRNYPLAHCH